MKPQHRGIGMTSQRTRERLVQRLQQEGIRNLAVLDQIRNTPRHVFVDEALASRAYEDTALPIGHGQTLSQPYVVARMTEALLERCAPRKVLEIGTGSGYQTAVLARLVERVYTVERIDPLLRQARNRFFELKIPNISARHSDGGWGWAEQAPFDGIIVTAAPEEVPKPLLEQLAVGGCLVMPVGPKGRQELLCVTRTASGYSREVLDHVSFVPLLGGLL